MIFSQIFLTIRTTECDDSASSNRYTAQKMKFSIKDFFSKYAQIRSKLWIWSHLLKKSLIQNFIFCAVIAIFMRKLLYIISSIYLYYLKLLILHGVKSFNFLTLKRQSSIQTVLKIYCVLARLSRFNIIVFLWKQQ